jgi:hypothetical protein
MRNSAGKPVTGLWRFIATGRRSLHRQETGLGQCCCVPLPGDCLACLRADLPSWREFAARLSGVELGQPAPAVHHPAGVVANALPVHSLLRT